MATIPTVAELRNYLKDVAKKFPDTVDGNAELQTILDAEGAAQRLDIDSLAFVNPLDDADLEYLPENLREALLRRCARNIALRSLPLGVQQGLDGSNGLYISKFDPEITRLEGGYITGPLIG